LALSEPLPDGTFGALLCESATDDWSKVSELLTVISPSIRIAAVEPVLPPSSVPQPDTVAVPSDTSPPHTEWSPPELTWDGPERWYSQPAGFFRVRLPQDWVIEERVRNRVADRDFDSLKDPTGQFVVICSRHGSPVSSTDRVLTRFAGLKLGQEKSKRSEVRYLTVGEAPAVRLSYLTEQTPPRSVTRTGFVMKNQFFVINTVAPGEAGTGDLPSNLQQLLDTLEFLPNAPVDLFYGPMGKQLLDIKALEGLTEDYGITVFEGGAVIDNRVEHLNVAFPIDQLGHPVMTGCEGFLNSDPEKRQQMGEPLTGEIIISDYRLCLQLFEGGFLIQDPLQQRVVQGIHKKRPR
jgi:hypothetical protein